MASGGDILVLAGTREAVALGDGLGAAVLRLGEGLPAPAREVKGPFDDALALDWRAAICGAHPFDTASGARVADMHPDLPLARFVRPAWQAEAEWTCVRDVAEAVRAIAPGQRVFAATGRESEAALAGYDGEVLLRQGRVHNGAPAASNIRYQFGHAAFDAASERALFARLGIDVLLARNLGGARGYGKIAAAHALGLRVVMVERPAQPGTVLETQAAVQDWLETLGCD